jgi:hypothetical protein
MGLIKLALETSPLVESDKDLRLLPDTVRQKPQLRIKPNKAIMNWGMKNETIT